MVFTCVSSQAPLPGTVQGHKFPTVCYFLHETLIIFGCCCGPLKTFMGKCQLVKRLIGEMPWPRVGDKGAALWGGSGWLSGA